MAAVISYAGGYGSLALAFLAGTAIILATSKAARAYVREWSTLVVKLWLVIAVIGLVVAVLPGQCSRNPEYEFEPSLTVS